MGGDPEQLRVLTCGSVDDGKSTLIGRLLYDCGQIPDDQLAALRRDSQRFGTRDGALDFALLVDGLEAEREQGRFRDVLRLNPMSHVIVSYQQMLFEGRFDHWRGLGLSALVAVLI